MIVINAFSAHEVNAVHANALSLLERARLAGAFHWRFEFSRVRVVSGRPSKAAASRTHSKTWRIFRAHSEMARAFWSACASRRFPTLCSRKNRREFIFAPHYKFQISPRANVPARAKKFFATENISGQAGVVS
jgi:hypothetical protein